MPSYQIRGYAASGTALSFSLDLPPGLIAEDPLEPDARVWSAVGVPVELRASWQRVAGASSLASALRAALRERGLLAPQLEREPLGGRVRRHPALRAGGELAQHGDRLRWELFALEGEGVLFLLELRCPSELWNDYGTFALAAARSFEIEGEVELSLPLADGEALAAPEPLCSAERELAALTPGERFLREARARREPALPSVRELLAAGRYEEAEQRLRAVDDTHGAAVELAKLYREHLRDLVARGALQRESERARRVFERALQLAWSLYPDPHTAYEAEDYARGQAADLAELVEIAGSDLRASC
ncbi:MAG: hypothetical protein IPN34_25285 [Planctomycetes bacterium]|nr:hypothetical protein [Planctomycetota bacterium]